MRDIKIRFMAYALHILYIGFLPYRWLHETCVIDEGDLTPSYSGYGGNDAQGFTVCLICHKRSLFVIGD